MKLNLKCLGGCAFVQNTAGHAHPDHFFPVKLVY